MSGYNPIDAPHRPSDNPEIRRRNFVEPGPRAEITRAQPAHLVIDDGSQFPAQVAQIEKTSAVDRAKGFSIKTNQLSIITATLTTVAAVALGVRGFLPVAVIALVGYFVTWAWAFRLDVRTSPGGIARQIATAKLRESGRLSRDYSDAYRRAHGLPPVRWWERLLR